MAIQTMITSLKNNKRNRKTAFDKKIASGGFGEFVDHKKMKTYEFAEFQKKMFKQKRIQKKKRIQFYIITLIIVILFILLTPYLLDFTFSDTLKPILHQ